MTTVTIRDASVDDAPAITDIYNALIRTTTIAWSEQLQSVAERIAWSERQHAEQFPILVAVDEGNGAVIGFASYGHFRGAGVWPGYRFTVEHTIHLGQSHWKCGIGRRLIESLIARAVAANIHVMVGAVDGANEASLRFHEKLGFEIVARLPEVGRKFDRWLDLVLVQKMLGDAQGQSFRC